MGRIFTSLVETITWRRAFTFLYAVGIPLVSWDIYVSAGQADWLMNVYRTAYESTPPSPKPLPEYKLLFCPTEIAPKEASAHGGLYDIDRGRTRRVVRNFDAGLWNNEMFPPGGAVAIDLDDRDYIQRIVICASDPISVSSIGHKVILLFILAMMPFISAGIKTKAFLVTGVVLFFLIDVAFLEPPLFALLGALLDRLPALEVRFPLDPLAQIINATAIFGS